MISFTIFLIILICLKKVAAEIKNINIPSCRNCIHYKPNLLNLDFDSSLNKCSKYGEKNIVTNQIRYDYADLCRGNEDKCGKLAKGWEKETNIDLKVFKYQIMLLYIPLFYISIIIINLFHK